MRGGIEVDPVNLGSACDTIPADADTLAAKPEAPLQSIEIDAACGIEVDFHFHCHVMLPIQAV
jgi:hypothetical protein